MVRLAIMKDERYPDYNYDGDADYYKDISSVSIGVLSQSDYTFVKRALTMYSKAQSILADVYNKYSLAK